MSRFFRWLFLLVLFFGICYGGFRVWQDRESKPAYEYRQEEITRGALTKKVTATGSLQAVTKTSVGSEVSGTVVKLHADFNSKVKKGDLLVELDPSTYVSQLDQQKAALVDSQAAYDNSVANYANAKSAVPKADAGVLSAQATVEAARATLAGSKGAVYTAQANVDKARAELEYSATNNTRQAQLLKRDLIAKSDMESARNSYLQDKANLASLVAAKESAEATYRSNLATMKAREADVRTAVYTRDGAVAAANVAQAQVTSAAAKVAQAKSLLVQAQLNLTRTKISSPIDGIVVARNVTIGQTVAAQFTTPDLFELAQNLEDMQVEVVVDEADIGEVKVGAPCSFTVDAYPEDTFTGRVSEVRLASTNTAGVITYTVIVKTRNPNLKLMPGMTATVGITVAHVENALLVPNAALRFHDPEEKPGQKSTPGGEDSASPSATPGGDHTPGRHHHGEGRGEGRGGGERGEGHGEHGDHGDRGGDDQHRRRRASRIYTLDANGKLVAHRVRLGISDGLKSQVLGHRFKEGDKVVVEAVAPDAATPIIVAPPGGPGGRRGGGGGMRF